jgi:hypothetical protein
MVRPKASEENLKIAFEFATSITSNILDMKNEFSQVECKGLNSIFAALRFCLPMLVRRGQSRVAAGEDGMAKAREFTERNKMTEIELNKYLSKNGFIKWRCRYRIRGTHSWGKEYLRWKSLRWINPKSIEDMAVLNSRLVEMVDRYPCTSSLDRDALISFLSKASSASSSILEMDGTVTLSTFESDTDLTHALVPYDGCGAAQSPYSWITPSTSNRCSDPCLVLASYRPK